MRMSDEGTLSPCSSEENLGAEETPDTNTKRDNKAQEHSEDSCKREQYLENQNSNQATQEMKDKFQTIVAQLDVENLVIEDSKSIQQPHLGTTYRDYTVYFEKVAENWPVWPPANLIVQNLSKPKVPPGTDAPEVNSESVKYYGNGHGHDEKVFSDNKEFNFYRFLLPDMEEFWADHKKGYDDHYPNEITELFPKIYPLIDNELIVFDNLVKDKGYRQLRQDGKKDLLTFEQTKVVLKKLAVLHGTSYAMVKSMGLCEFKEKYADCLCNEILSEEEVPFKDRLEASFHVARKVMKEFLIEQTVDPGKRLKEYNGKTVKLLTEAINIPDPWIRVLTHGELWKTNLLLSIEKESGKLEDVKLIGMRAPKLVSPAQDILWLFHTCLDREIRRLKKWEELLKFYHSELKSVVEELGGRLRGTFEDLREDYVAHRQIGLILGMQALIGTKILADYDPADSQYSGRGVLHFFHKWRNQKPRIVFPYTQEFFSLISNTLEVDKPYTEPVFPR